MCVIQQTILDIEVYSQYTANCKTLKEDLRSRDILIISEA